MEQIEHPVEPPEIEDTRSGFDSGPGEDADADEIDTGLPHQVDVLDPDRLVPLLGVVVAPEGEAVDLRPGLPGGGRNSLIDGADGDGAVGMSRGAGHGVG